MTPNFCWRRQIGEMSAVGDTGCNAQQKFRLVVIFFGGERGIRTPGDREATTVFKTDAFVRSAISPPLTVPTGPRWDDRIPKPDAVVEFLNNLG